MSADIQAQLRAALADANAKIAVIDDDPTGTQTVSDVPLITSWGHAELGWALARADPMFVVLTNSRADSEDDAITKNAEIGERLARVARHSGFGLRVISRSDSTLRGHFPTEPEALSNGLERSGWSADCILVCPAYPQAGRVTVDDVHWLKHGDAATPIAETEFARDPAFGYRSSDLKDWVRERAGRQASVTSISLKDIREGGPDGVSRALFDARGSSRYVVANAADERDLDTLALGVELAEQCGLRIISRTGPSFLSARAGLPTATPLDKSRLGTSAGPGLVVVGSHTALTTGQVEHTVQAHQLPTVELDVEDVVNGDSNRRAAGVATAEHEVRAALASGDAALVTSRKPARADRGQGSLSVAAMIASALVEIVRAVAKDVPLGWLIAKGGITSHDLAVKALGATRANVLGQLFPGQVSVWQLGEGSIQPGLRYVVFAGNVGEQQTLSEAIDRLKETA